MKAIRVGADSRPARVKEHLKAASHTNAIKTVIGSALFLLAALLGAAVSGFANAEPSCMTEAEARAAHPRAHLYWHTARHCWDNIPGGQQRYDVAKPVEKPPAVPQAKPASMTRDRKSTGMPSLVQGTGVDGEIITRDEQIAMWPPIIDLSALTPAAEMEGKANTADQEAVLDIRNPNDFNEIDAMAVSVNTIQADDKGIWRSLILLLIAIVAFSVTISRWLIWMQRVRISSDDELDGVATT
jgi:uncharacterized iron-regulated membrane protein